MGGGAPSRCTPGRGWSCHIPCFPVAYQQFRTQHRHPGTRYPHAHPHLDPVKADGRTDSPTITSNETCHSFQHSPARPVDPRSCRHPGAWLHPGPRTACRNSGRHGRHPVRLAGYLHRKRRRPLSAGVLLHRYPLPGNGHARALARNHRYRGRWDANRRRHLRQLPPGRPTLLPFRQSGDDPLPLERRTPDTLRHPTGSTAVAPNFPLGTVGKGVLANARLIPL